MEELDDYEAQSKAIQHIKIVGRTVICQHHSKELAQFYCPCGMFLCVECFIRHKCLVIMSQTYSESLIKALK